MSRFTKLMGIMLVVFTFTTVTGVKAYHTNRVRIEAQKAERLKQERQLPKSKSGSSLAGDERTPVTSKKKDTKKAKTPKTTSKTKNADLKTSSQNTQDSNASSASSYSN